MVECAHGVRAARVQFSAPRPGILKVYRNIEWISNVGIACKDRPRELKSCVVQPALVKFHTRCGFLLAHRKFRILNSDVFSRYLITGYLVWVGSILKALERVFNSPCQFLKRRYGKIRSYYFWFGGF